MSVTLISWNAPGSYSVAFSTRLGGVSEGSFDSLNLGLMTHDEPANVQENRRRLCEAAGADPARLAMNRQVHAATVNRAEAGERGREGDGLWTDEPGIPMIKVTADCLPIALARRNGERPALALLHAGRLGLLEGIVDAGVAALGGKLGLLRPLAPGRPFLEAEVAWAARHELALSLDDVLARRTRLAVELPDRGAAIAPRVAAILGRELGWGEARQALEVQSYLASATREYSVAPSVAPDA